MIFASSASAPPGAACASATRRWPGDATSTTTATPGRSCGAPITPRSDSSSTASTHWPAATDPRDPLDPRRQDLPRPARRRAEARHGHPVLEPALPLFPGQGDLPVGDFMAAIAATGYAGPLSLEIFNDQFRAGSARADRGRRPALADPAAGPACRGLAEPSASPWRRKPRCSGIGFIEFAVNETKAGELVGRLLGSSASARPASTSSQGGEALVAGQGRARRQLRDRGLCAFALRHARPRRLRHRARRRRCRPRHDARRNAEGAHLPPAGRPGRAGDPRDPRRRRQPAVFLDRPGRPKTGTPISRRSPSDAGADAPACSRSTTSRSRCPTTRCCPGCCSTPASSTSSGCRRWRSPTPGASCRARPSSTRDQSLRFVLNGSSANRTLPARFISEFFGSGVQHVAFACRTFWRGRREMRKRGADFLDIPDNYYDDIEAKYDLAPD